MWFNKKVVTVYYVKIWLHASFYYVFMYLLKGTPIIIFRVSGKILLEAAQLQYQCKADAFHYLYVSTVPVHHMCSASSKCKLMTCTTHVLCVFTGSHAHAKIVYNTACACQILSFTCNKYTGTHVYWHMSVKFKLSCIVIRISEFPSLWLLRHRSTIFITKSVLVIEGIPSRCTALFMLLQGSS